MSTTLDKQSLVRAAWCVELRRQGHRQCRNTRRDDFGGACVMELLREISGAPCGADFGNVGALAGLAVDQVLDLICRNDGRCGYRKHTFAELADVVEAWFP